eukprot:458986-Prymnesium_polylepis.2
MPFQIFFADTRRNQTEIEEIKAVEAKSLPLSHAHDVRPRPPVDTPPARLLVVARESGMACGCVERHAAGLADELKHYASLL